MPADTAVDCAAGLSGGPFDLAEGARVGAESGRLAASEIINCDGKLWALLHQEKEEELA